MIATKNIVKLSIRSSTLGRTMIVDLGLLSGFKGFWKNPQTDNPCIWQTLTENYINKPYLDVPRLFSRFYDIKYDDFTVYHRNHDVTHAVRQRFYAKNYLNIIETYGNAKYAPIARQVKNNPEVQACLELAVFLCRSGRTNEKSGQEDPDNAKRSAELFERVATESEFNPGLINFLKFAIGTHAPRPDQYQHLLEGLPGEDKLQLAALLKGVIDLSHHTDLVRCKVGSPKQPVREQIETDLGEFLDDSKVNIHRATTNLLLQATQACKMTGTRVKFKTFGQQDNANTPLLKIKHTRNVAASMEALMTIPLDLHKIAHEGLEGDMAESLRQTALNGELDLTNRFITPKYFEQIKKCIENSVIKKVNLLGTKPVELQKELVELLREKSGQQTIPIEMNHVEELEKDVISDFNRQFRQKALDHKKVSMRFEPSRLGAAMKQGAGAFFSQLHKEIKGDIPKFGGDEHFSQITGIKKLSNSAIEARYEQNRKEIEAAPLGDVLLRELQTIATDDIALKPGEMLLYHGTSVEAAPIIMQNGFSEDRCNYVNGNGYGPLGKGVYFTSELSKAATFSRCAECGQSGQCSCVKKGSNLPADRVVLLCRVFVGTPEIVLKKGDIRERTKPADSFDSCIALSSEIDPLSEFHSTEVCVPSGSQVIPLYEITFSSQPNILNTAAWKKIIKENGLDSVHTGVEILGGIRELEQLTDNNAPFQELKNQALKIGVVVTSAVAGLTDKQNELKDSLPSNKKALQRIESQLRDLSNLQGQLRAFQGQSSALRASKQRQLSNPATNSVDFGMKKKSIDKLLDFFLPKEYRLKRECAALAANMNNKSLAPKPKLAVLTQWLSLAIARDQYKGTTLSLLGSRHYPMHRIILTQKMIRLRDALRDLQELRADNEVLRSETHRLLSGTMQSLNAIALSNPQISRSTNYCDLQVFMEAAGKAVVDKAKIMAPEVTSGDNIQGKTTNRVIPLATYATRSGISHKDAPVARPVDSPMINRLVRPYDPGILHALPDTKSLLKHNYTDLPIQNSNRADSMQGNLNPEHITLHK